MKGISYCDECANYDWENERCNKGASIEDDYGRIYQDCPLPDAEPVRHGKWVEWNGMDIPENHGRHKCSICGEFAIKPKYGEEILAKRCPNCGAKMMVIDHA